jgi:hypothetical protein
MFQDTTRLAHGKCASRDFRKTGVAPGLLNLNRAVCGGQYVNNLFVLILTAFRSVHAARDKPKEITL